MSHNSSLLPGAILITDAHCAPWRTSFIDFLKAIERGEIQTPQLILMGDIFDMLYGPIRRTYGYNTDGIELLNRLAERMEIIYLEGNHDFLLEDIFPDIHVVRREEQPLILTYGDKKVSLSHGDTVMGWGYELYTALIRSPFVLGILRRIDDFGDGFIVRWLEKEMKRKHHCRTIEGFEAMTRSRFSTMKRDEVDIYIEGHFHQNCEFTIEGNDYINVGAFACNERYFSVQSIPNQPLLREAVFRKEPL